MKRKRVKRWSYKTKNNKGKHIVYSPVFESKKEMQDWYEKHGEWMEKNLNRKLVPSSSEFNYEDIKIRIVKSEHGYRSLRIQAKQFTDLNNISLCVCDSCGNEAKGRSWGFYIAVLNSYYCNDCFKEWSKHARFYESDRETENKRIESMKQKIADYSGNK